MSKSPRGGLGRGIESLIRTSATASSPQPTDPPPPASTSLPLPASDTVANPPAVADATPDVSPVAAPVPTAGTSAPAVNDARLGQERVARARPASSSASPLDVFWGSSGPAPTDAPLRPEFRDLAVDDIHANAKQPRTIFDDDALAELAHSISEFGVLQPIVVRPDPSGDGRGYELVMGERRLRAARDAGLSTIPAVIRHTADEAMLRDALLENVHRAQLNPLEEAAAYRQLLEEFGVTHDELAARIGRSRSQVTNTVRLMNLSLPVQRRVASGVLSAGHARALLALTDADAQDDLAARIVAEGLSVRATEELVSLTAKGLLGAGRRRPARRFVAPAATDLAERLSDRFDTTVRVEIGRRKGKVTIEFATVDDLERIVSVMAPELATQHPATAAAASASTPAAAESTTEDEREHS